jgi:hypothetical protein
MDRNQYFRARRSVFSAFASRSITMEEMMEKLQKLYDEFWRRAA